MEENMGIFSSLCFRHARRSTMQRIPLVWMWSGGRYLLLCYARIKCCLSFLFFFARVMGSSECWCVNDFSVVFFRSFIWILQWYWSRINIWSFNWTSLQCSFSCIVTGSVTSTRENKCNEVGYCLLKYYLIDEHLF